MQYSLRSNGLPKDGKPCGCGHRSTERWRNIERGPVGDEPTGVLWEGETLEGINPMSVSSMKQGCKEWKGQNPKGLREAEGGWRSGGTEQYAALTH